MKQIIQFSQLSCYGNYKNIQSSFYMRNYYNNPRPQLSNMSFLFISKYMFLQIKVCRAYSRNLGQRSILARKGIYEKCIFFKKVPQKFTPSPLIESFLQFLQKGQRWTQYRSTICPGMFTIIFTLFVQSEVPFLRG